MQSIKHKEKSINGVFEDIEHLYALSSEKTSEEIFFADYSFTLLIDCLVKYGNIELPVVYGFMEYENIPPLKRVNEKNIILCFSGGKDSTAAALHYKARDYNVLLYHLKGINKTYKDEYLTAQEVAKALELPLVIEEISLVGNHCYTEHPMKNMIIANQALQYGIKSGFGTAVAFGNYYTSHIKDEPFAVCGGDTVEMWEAYESIIRRVIADFEIKVPLCNVEDSFNTLLSQPSLLYKIKSCIGPYRYREYLHANNEKKYNIKLLPHRCGSCWKCAMEYIWFTDRDVLEYNEAYYRHCLKVLQKNSKTETGFLEKDLQKIWNHYFFYNCKREEVLDGCT